MTPEKLDNLRADWIQKEISCPNEEAVKAAKRRYLEAKSSQQ